MWLTKCCACRKSALMFKHVTHSYLNALPSLSLFGSGMSVDYTRKQFELSQFNKKLFLSFPKSINRHVPLLNYPFAPNSKCRGINRQFLLSINLLTFPVIRCPQLTSPQNTNCIRWRVFQPALISGKPGVIACLSIQQWGWGVQVKLLVRDHLVETTS